MPKQASLELSGIFKDMGLTPLCLDVYTNCIALALERGGENAVCVTSGGIVYAAGGQLREIVTPAGARELQLLLDAAPDITAAFNPAGYSWADDILARAGIDAGFGFDLGLIGLLKAGNP
jgi:hypothetical protein